MSGLVKWLARQIFIVSLAGYILLAFIEEFREGFVSNYLSLNWLLLFVLLGGLITFRFPPGGDAKATEKKGQSRLWVFASTAATVVLVWFGASGFALSWRIILSLYGGLLTAAILLILFEE